MVFSLGTGQRDEYYEYELTAAAHKLVTEFRPVSAGQQVLITADTASDARTVRATAGAVFAMGAIPTVITYPTLPAPMLEPPAPVLKAVTAADIWFDFPLPTSSTVRHITSPLSTTASMSA